MTPFLERLQDSSFSLWFLGSESIWAYPTVLTLHTVGLAILVGASLLVHLRVLGFGAAVPFAALGVLFRYVWIGFAINLASGVVLFISAAADRASQPVFLVKLAAIAAALWLGQLVKRRAFARPDDERAGAGGARIMAVAALCSWTVAIVAGRLMAYM